MNARFNLPPGVTPDDIDPPATRDEDAALDAADHDANIAREDPDNCFVDGHQFRKTKNSNI